MIGFEDEKMEKNISRRKYNVVLFLKEKKIIYSGPLNILSNAIFFLYFARSISRFLKWTHHTFMPIFVLPFNTHQTPNTKRSFYVCVCVSIYHPHLQMLRKWNSHHSHKSHQVEISKTRFRLIFFFFFMLDLKSSFSCQKKETMNIASTKAQCLPLKLCLISWKSWFHTLLCSAFSASCKPLLLLPLKPLRCFRWVNAALTLHKAVNLSLPNSPFSFLSKPKKLIKNWSEQVGVKVPTKEGRKKRTYPCHSSQASSLFIATLLTRNLQEKPFHITFSYRNIEKNVDFLHPKLLWKILCWGIQYWHHKTE